MSSLAIITARRIATMAVAFLGATVVIFFILHLTGDPTTLLLPESATPQQIAAFRAAQGFDRPLIAQYWTFLTGLLHGDFGASLRYQQPALDVVLDRLPATAQLMVSAMVLTLLISVPLAFYGAIKDNKVSHALLRMTTVLGQGVPGFVLAV